MTMHEGIVVGRAITHAPDIEGALRDFAILCHELKGDEGNP
jgi:hypothetical protein